MNSLFPDLAASESPRLKWQKRIVAEHRIFTHHSDLNNWLAFSQTKAIELLQGYDLTPDQKEFPIELFAHYCRLLEEAGHIADRQSSEFDAICAVCQIHAIKLWNEEAAARPPVF